MSLLNFVADATDDISQLLDHEPRAGDQVPLLLTMKEDRLALTKAVDSGDTDLGWCLFEIFWFVLTLGPFIITSLPCAASSQTPPQSGGFLPTDRRWRAKAQASSQPSSSLCPTAE